MGKRNGKKDRQDVPVGERSAVSPEHEEAVQGHNLTALKAGIRAAFAKLYDAEREIERAMLDHVEPLKADRRDIWNAIKTDSGIERTDLDLLYRLYKRTREAKDFDEDAARDRVMDNLRTVFGALAEGGQLDFVTALDAAPPARNGAGNSAFKRGESDFGRSIRFDQCPFPLSDNANRDAWEHGWHRAHDAWSKDAPPSETPEAPAEGAAAH